MFQTDVTEEYLLYGLDSFIADVGGFLGLLLGASLLSLIEEILDIFDENACGKNRKKTTHSPQKIELSTIVETESPRSQQQLGK